MKFWKKCLITLAVLVITFAVFLIYNIPSLDVEKLNKDIFVIRGVGGNTTVLNTSAGAVVIDSMTFKQQGKLIKSKAEQLSGKQVVLLINTHYHLDHTHGNPGFDSGIKIMSTERTLSHLKKLDSNSWEGDAAFALPNETFSDMKEIKLGDKTLRLIHPGLGHTDGDLIVHFVEDDVLVLGDLFFNKHYPNIDLEAGGSIAAWPDTLDKVLAIGASTIIPGHGETTHNDAVVQFQTFMRQLHEVGQLSVEQNLSLEDTIKNAKFNADQQYTEIVFAGIPLGLDREFVLTRAWQEANKQFELKN